MSVFAGPSIATNGLVFHYDISNTQKSWVGAPTTNVVVNKLPTTGWGVNNYLTSSATTTFETENGIPHLKITNVTTDSGYPRLQDSYLSSTVTDGCSASFEAKGTPGAQLYLSIYSSGSTKIQNLATLTSDWQRFTFNNIVTGFVLDQPYLRPLTNTATYYVRNIQIEQNTISTPFTNSSRTNIQAVLDLTSNNIITATSLTYSVDGSFSFNGTSNYLRPNITHSYLSSSALEVWFRSTSHGGAGVKKTIFGYSHNDGYSYPTIGSMYLENTNLSASVITASQVYRTVTAASAISTSTWYHAVLNKDTVNGTLNLYLNGILSGTQTFDPVSYGQWTTTGTYIGVNVLDIGKSTNNSVVQGWSTAYFSGSIPVAKVYSRVLTDAEIQGNFNAARSRFGL